MSDEKLLHIEDKIDRILGLLLATVPKHKIPSKLRKLNEQAQTPEETMAIRKKEMIRIHKVAGRDLSAAIKQSQKYPVAISKGGLEIVPKSVLLNRCSVSRVFAPVTDYHETSGILNAEACLAALEGQLVVASLSDTKISQPGSRISSAVCVFSAEEYGRQMEDKKPKVDVVSEKPIVGNPNVWIPPVKKSKLVTDPCPDCGIQMENGVCTDCRIIEL